MDPISASKQSPILSTSGLSIGYGRKIVVSGLNLTLPSAQVTALIGRNGAGKSTLLKTLTRHLHPIAGEIKIGGKELKTLTRKEMAKMVATVSTEPHMAERLRVEELVGLGRIPYTGRIGLLSAEDRKKVAEAMATVGIAHKRLSYVEELSDGERQKAMIARGLVQETPLILMDEPFSYLDVAARIETLDLLCHIAHTQNRAVLFSTHEVTQALRMADRVWMIVQDPDSGLEVIEQGTPREVTECGLPDRLFPGSRVKFDPQLKDYSLYKQ